MNTLFRCLTTSLLAVLFCAGGCVVMADDTERPYFEEISRINIGRPRFVHLAMTPDGRFALASVVAASVVSGDDVTYPSGDIIQVWPIHNQGKLSSLGAEPVYSTEYDSFNTKLIMPSAIKVTGGDGKPVRAYVLSVFLYHDQTTGDDTPGTRISGYEVTDEGNLKSITGGYINFYKLMDNGYTSQLLEIEGPLLFAAINANTLGLGYIHQNGSLSKISEHTVPIDPEYLMLGDLAYASGSEKLIASVMSVGKGAFPETLQSLVYSVNSSGEFQQDTPVKTYRIGHNATNLYTHLTIAPAIDKWVKASRGVVEIAGEVHVGVDLALVDGNTGEEFQFGKALKDSNIMPWDLNFNHKEDRLFLSGIQQNDGHSPPMAAFKVAGDSLSLISNSLSQSRLFHGHFVVFPDDCHVLAVAGGKIADTNVLPDESDYLILYGINDPESNCSVSPSSAPDLQLPLSVGLSAGVVTITAAITLTVTVYCLLKKHYGHRGYTPLDGSVQ